jgi:CHAT domain-containing protein
MNNFSLQVGVALATLVTTGIASINAQTLVAQANVAPRTPPMEKLTAQASNIDQLWQQASELRGIGKYNEAIAIFDQLLKLQPNSFLAWYWRGNSLSNLGQYESAIASYEQAIKIKPDYLLAWFEQGNAFYELQQYDAGIRVWRQALSLKGESEYGKQLVSRIIPSRTASVLLYDLQRYEEAIALYNQLLSVESNTAATWINRGTAFYQLARYQDALVDFDRAIQLDARNALAWKRRGFALYRLDRNQQAIASFERAAKLEPDDLDVAGLLTALKTAGASPTESRTSQQRLASLRNEISAAEKRLVNLRAESQTATTQLQASQAEVRQSQQRLATIQGEIKTAEERLGTSQTTLRQSQQQLVALTGEIQTTQKKLDSLQAERQSLEQRLVAVRGEIKAAEEQLKTSQSQVRQSQQQLAGIQMEIQSTQPKLNSLQAERQSLEQTLVGRRGEIEAVEKRLAALQAERQRSEQRQVIGREITPSSGAGLEAFQAEIQIFQQMAQQESNFTDAFAKYLGISVPSVKTLSETLSSLRQIGQATGAIPALSYSFFMPKTKQGETTTSGSKSLGLPTDKLALSQNQKEQDDDQLELVLVTADGKPIRRRVEGATRSQIRQLTEQFFSNVTNVRNPDGYLEPAQKLYKLLVAPLEQDQTFQNQKITNLTFLMDKSLRSIPLAALHDGKGFLAERYSVGIMPSLALTDTRYGGLKNQQVLAMGAQVFPDQRPLPAVPIELNAIAKRLWSGDSFLNEAFTVDNLKQARQREPYGIVHFATHAEFRPGQPSNSYIELWGGNKLRLDQLSELKFKDNPPVDLLVLSACRTAVGNDQAELGFAGLAVLAGVKSAMGSLWYVSDEGTLALMSAFYKKLKEVPVKAEALRLAQVAMIRGDVRIEGGQLVVENERIPLPPELAKLGDKKFSHPYYWSAFTMIGNPW